MGDGNWACGHKQDVCSWVPEAAFRYLAHTERGASIRGLAREAGCHASTILRQVRAYEARRDDPLVDEALRRLGTCLDQRSPLNRPVRDCDQSTSEEDEMTAMDVPQIKEATPTLNDARLCQEARRILRRLCETGAVLAVAAEMEKAVVVRETEAGSNRIAVVDREIAEAMALKNWIACAAQGRISRYKITGAGRVTLDHLLAETDEEEAPFNETEGAFLGTNGTEDPQQKRRRKRYGVAESPLVLLARRRGNDGARFLSEALVRAGERLREDYEMAQVCLTPETAWKDVVATFETQEGGNLARATRSARDRVKCALDDLGPGLGDVTLRCCCFLEGLETAEKKMGWSARSGKIVLRIALQRLKRHYDALGDAASMMG